MYMHVCIISFIQLTSHIDFDIVNAAPAPLTVGLIMKIVIK